MEKREVIPGGWISLLWSAGSDLEVVNSARISFDKWHDTIEEGDDNLIDFLMRNRHGTPFEMIEFCFQVRAPITVIREWQRHRIASYNEMSGRYVEMQNDCYLPDHKAIRIQKGKPGNYHFEPVNETTTELEVKILMAEAYKVSYDIYQELLNRGIAKELARNVLPLGLFSEFRFKTNARSLMNFISLRNAENAMLEIRKYAEAIEEDFKEVAPITYEAFVKHGRKSP